jgi:ribonuclease BN (tRNA processing enzyme)
MAIAMAKEAGARRLALTHFDAWAYRTLEERVRVGEEFQESFPGLTIATDGLVLEL